MSIYIHKFSNFFILLYRDISQEHQIKDVVLKKYFYSITTHLINVRCLCCKKVSMTKQSKIHYRKVL